MAQVTPAVSIGPFVPGSGGVFPAAGLGGPPASNYDSLRLYTEALFEVSQKYVWPKNEEDLIYGSLRGMMNSLDPDSSFLTAKEYQDYLQGPPQRPGRSWNGFDRQRRPPHRGQRHRWRPRAPGPV